MKIVRTNRSYQLYEDDMETLDRLPTLVYEVQYQQRVGFFLQERENFEIAEKKVYGIHTEKVEKILDSFSYFNRNLGVLLSGEKGIGKSLFVKMLAWKVMEQGIPVITVTKAYGELTTFLNKIAQEVLVLFDEFDKNFSTEESQNTLLSLFDGMSSGKKLFAITCNSTATLSEFLIGRPGRFHYHIRFEYPHPSEVKEYLEDNVRAEFHKEINAVACHSMIEPLSFDSLRAIAFELNQGESFEEMKDDLNLPNNKKWGNFSILMWNGETAVYGASEVEINFAEDCFHAFVSRVITGKGPSYSLINTEVYLAVCSLQGYQMDFETGMITIPAENVSLQVVGSKKSSKRIESITSVKLICEGFGKRPKMEEVETSKAVEKKEEKKEEEKVDFLGFLCEVD